MTEEAKAPPSSRLRHERALAQEKKSVPERVAPAAKVLVVDDNLDLNFLIRERLSRLGYEVDGAGSGEEAQPMLEQGGYDIIFLDVSLPGMSGLSLLDWIRAQALDAAVIMTTAYGSEQVAMDALRRGADDYLPKIRVPEEFEAILERTVARLRLNRQNAALRRQLDEKHRQLEAELGRAALVQAELLPSHFPVMPGFELTAHCVPAREVGGDFYDWQQPVPGTFTVTLCDVMGKGMPAALLMATVRATMRAVVRNSPPADAMQYIVSTLTSDLDRSGSLVTMFLGQLDTAERRLTYVDAGHGHVFLLRATGEVEPLPVRGLPLGILDDATYEQGQVTFGPGDALVLYSDGLIDANPELDLGPESLAEVLRGEPSAGAMIQRLLRLAACEGPPPDDLTIVVLRCLSAPR